MRCPVCRAIYRPAKDKSETTSVCKRCGLDLAPLIRIHDQALWYHRQALHFLQRGDHLEARRNNEQAIALHQNNADFHALAGRLWALDGEFLLAAVSWKKALRLEAQQPLASNCLQILTEKITSERYH